MCLRGDCLRKNYYCLSCHFSDISGTIHRTNGYFNRPLPWSSFFHKSMSIFERYSSPGKLIGWDNIESGESEAWASQKNQSSSYHANCSQLQCQAREIGTNRIGLISFSNIYMQLSDECRCQLLGLILCLIQCAAYEKREGFGETARLRRLA